MCAEITKSPGDVVIDSKFPLKAWHQLWQADDKAARRVAHKKLGVDVLKHFRDIQGRYIITGETAESARCLGYQNLNRLNHLQMKTYRRL